MKKADDHTFGFMLIEVLIALALFGLSAVYLVDGAFIASKTIRVMKNTREMEQDLLWVRGEILKETDYEKLKDGRHSGFVYGGCEVGVGGRDDRCVRLVPCHVDPRI